MTMRWISLLVAALVLLASCGGPECDADGLTAALASASSGDVVEVGACRIEGDFTLPAGVALEGVADSVIAGRIDLMGGGTVEQLAIESTDAGLVAQNGGAVVVRNVELVANSGIGIAADGVSSLLLENVRLRGPVNAGNLS